jgi:hypothetical protein
LITETGQRLPGAWRGPPPADPHAAELAISPGDVRLHAVGPHAPDSIRALEATVASVTFGGESSAIHLVLSGGARLAALEHGPPQCQEGDQVFVSWNPTAATLFPQSIRGAHDATA